MTRGKLSQKILNYELFGFGIVIGFLWLDEIFDIPHYLFGSAATPVNYAESLLETVIVFILGLFVILGTIRLLNRIDRIAMYDAVTDLMNRRFILQHFENEIHRSRRSNRPFGIVMADIDDFKSINDRFGHECGDIVLKQIAIRLKGTLRLEDLIGRWGGEEFLILLPDTALIDARHVAEKLRKNVENSKMNYQNDKMTVTMSFGVTVYDYRDTNPDTYIRKADKRLYAAKRHGKNKVV